MGQPESSKTEADIEKMLSGTNKTTETTNVVDAFNSSWFWVSMILLLLWLVTVGLWVNARRSIGGVSKVDTGNHRESAGGSMFSGNALKQIKSACDSNNPQLAKETLINWGQNVWPDRPPTSLSHIAERVNGVLSQELNKLNSVLYRQENKSGQFGWDSAALWKAIQDFAEDQKKKADNSKPSAIKPLYRIVANQEN